MKAVFFDNDTGQWTEYLEPVSVRSIDDLADIPGALEETTRRAEAEGLHAVFILSYEASPAFDASLTVRAADRSPVPLAWFALFSGLKPFGDLSAVTPPDADRGFSVGPFAPTVSIDEYRAAFDRVKEHLKQGNSYQVNLALAFRALFSGSPFGWFSSIAHAGHGRFLSYLETDEWAVCSFSPELFFEKRGDTVTLRPMKGTIPTPEGDPLSACESLRSSGKNRAENLMIVDMIRNDIGRVAETGTVTVPSLFETEVYETVIQMTSTVRARVAKGIPDILSALFPCASITGAPKRRSMDIIAELEASGRGLYTGAIGRIEPNLDCVCSVAIRTAVLDKRARSMRYGCGSGIVWDSDREEEWAECLAKAAVIESGEPFHAFESFLVEDGKAFLADRHFERLVRSCRFFGIMGDLDGLKVFWDRTIAELEASYPQGAFKAKITYDGARAVLTDCSPAPSLPSPYRVTLASSRVESADPFVAHKTNRRRHVEAAMNGIAGFADVILVNERGELTETTRGNLALMIGGRLFTPPESSGLLPGVWRDELLARGELEERTLYPEDLYRADAAYMLNSVRRSVECVIS